VHLRGPLKSATTHVNKEGQTYKVVNVSSLRPSMTKIRALIALYLGQFNICLAFGDTELTARVSWSEKVVRVSC
jgi:hypothetical protein